jgi:hypothetical protein
MEKKVVVRATVMTTASDYEHQIKTDYRLYDRLRDGRQFFEAQAEIDADEIFDFLHTAIPSLVFNKLLKKMQEAG